MRFPGSCCLSATGVRLLDHPSPAEEFSFPCGRLTEHVWTVRTSSGFSRSTRVRYDRVGCPLYSGTVVLSQLKSFIQLAPAAFQRPVLDLSGAIHLKRLTLTKHSVRGSSPSPVRPFPSPVTPGWNEGPWASPWASDPAVTHDARQDGDEPRALARTYTFGISRPPIRCVHLRCATSCRTHRSSSLRCGRCMLTPPTRREEPARTEERATTDTGARRGGWRQRPGE